MNTITEIQSSIESLGAIKEKITAAVSERYQRLEVLAGERGRIVSQPVSRRDYTTLVWRMLDLKAEHYRQRLTDELRKSIFGNGDPGQMKATVGSAMRVNTMKPDDMLGILPGQLRGAVYGGDFDREPLTQLAATYFLLDEMKLATADALDGIANWPKALPLKASLAKIGEIDREMLSIESELELLKKDAHRIGLALPPKPVKVEPIQPGSWEWLNQLTESVERRRRQEAIDDPLRARSIVVRDGVRGWMRMNLETCQEEFVPER
ncbi:hypothetical protein I5U90_18220 [Stenotrophomonas maltophilia]|uniref:hypothetical protein n=1 Tax=Stenotrophomonas maltophilia TaxID=40324 RepID=UPI001312AC07|nr:hypothetical protein [Stenotrophomonas maltophilia]MBH1674958.1 hypothetical protein [Stenotrophomonas maltophilia]MDH2038129.1 hypothetical protein [Stenotrophomonas maltophilia]HEL5340293.1 hypothetical protein [Stenotrophomonas maltophilia]